MAFLLIGILAVFLVGVAWSYYTRRGLGIAAHPTDGRGLLLRTNDQLLLIQFTRAD